MNDASGAGILDEGLSRISVTGPEYGGGMSNHAPMGAEALVRLGRADVVEHWLDDYLRRLDEPPAPGDRITDQTWRDALGAMRRVADWELYFREQMTAQPWRDVLARWWPRLLPGLAAAATHGIIRTSHAARSLAAADTAERRDELARGLAYWAAGYLELPGSPRTAGRLDLAAALGGLPVASERATPGLITEILKAGLAVQPAFPAAVSALRPPADAAADLGDLAREFTRVFLRYGRERPIALLHAVTAPVAARSVLPLLPGEVARPTYDALWQAGAALYAVYTGAVIPEPLPASAPPSPDTVTEQAVATGDVHAIKLTEACLRLHAESPDPVLLHAAARASQLLA
jgi:Questin oxidase-like